MSLQKKLREKREKCFRGLEVRLVITIIFLIIIHFLIIIITAIQIIMSLSNSPSLLDTFPFSSYLAFENASPV